MGFFYRIHQAWNALTAKPAESDLEEVKSFLSPTQFSLFSDLHPSEQSHSIGIYHQLLNSGVNHPDLLTAALLHDVGKNRYPLHIWDRIIIVIGRGISPHRVDSWSQGDPDSWKRPFVVSKKHAEWGAQMAADAGASQLTVKLINRHQEQLPARHNSPSQNNSNMEGITYTEDQLLYLLQHFDNNN